MVAANHMQYCTVCKTVQVLDAYSFFEIKMRLKIAVAVNFKCNWCKKWRKNKPCTSVCYWCKACIKEIK